MKKHILLLALLVQILFLSCDGKFIEDDLGIFLTFPRNKEACYEGTKTGDKVDIPFEWTLVGENLGELQIEINELDDNKVLVGTSDAIITPITSDQVDQSITLDYGKWYQWKIVSSIPDVKSKVFTFYSQGEPEENTAPFPSQINIISNNGGNLQFTWEAAFDKENNDLLYDVFFDKNPDPDTKIRSDESEPVSVSQPNLDINADYYIKVVAKENLAGDTVGNSSISIKKVRINP